MLGKISHLALPVDVTRTLSEIYLEQARAQKKLENFEVALPLYDQVKETLKSHGSVKEALRKAQDPQTLTDEALRAMMADAYFERGEVLEGLSFFDKAQASYLKAKKWGYVGAKHHAEASYSPPLGHSTHSNRSAFESSNFFDKAQAGYLKAKKWGHAGAKHLAEASQALPLGHSTHPSRPTWTQTAMPSSMPAQQLAASSAEEKSALVDYLFEKALLTLSSLEVPNKPSLFLVYAHDNPMHGKAEASTSKYLIDKLSNIRGVNLYSDQTPMGQAYSSSAAGLKENGKLEDILTNQLCLLPARLIKDVAPVDKVVVCCSEVLGRYLKDWSDYRKFYEELREAYGKDREAYLKDDGQKGSSAIREVVRKFSQEDKYKAGFHHVLTEMAFLQIRAEHLNDQHGIIPVSLTSNSYDQCLAYFIPATTVRMEDIPRFEEQAQAGREVYANQSRHGVLFKVIERLLVDSDEANTFLSKFWYGHGEFISRLKSDANFGRLEFAKLLDGIFDGIRTALQSQLASTVQQEHQQLRVLNADPRAALKEQYFAALKEDEVFEEIRQLYVEPRGQASVDGKVETFKLLSQVQEFLKDKKVILLTGDSGAGKTTFNRRLEKHLWDDKKAEDDAIPLFISLASIDKPEQDLIPKTLKKRGLSDFQIQKLKKEKQRFVFILDGYDEIRQTQNLYLSNFINQSGSWQGHMIISCRSEYLGQDYRSRFQPNPKLQDKDTLFQEVIVQPFSEVERNQYLKEYVKHTLTDWSEQDYQKALEEPNLKDLASNPFLLRVVLEALPYVEKRRAARTAVQLRLDLYEQFAKQWFERNQQRLSTQNLTGTQKEIFRELYDDGFAQHGIGFVQELAVHLYTENGGNPVVDYSLFKDKGSWKDTFFGREEENQLLRDAWPLIRSGNHYRFIHKSLLEYFVVRALFESFDACIAPNSRPRRGSDASVYSFEKEPVLRSKTLQEVSLTPKHWVDDLGVVRLLTERVEQEPSFKKQLLAIIERSKTDKTVRHAAANAITILVRARVQFSGADLQGIQVPGADLSFGLFDSAQLQGADLRKANLRAIWLSLADLSGAQMSGVQFGEWPYLQEKSTVTSCTYSPEGGNCAVGLANDKISVYSTSSWKKIHTLRGHTSAISSVVYAPSGSQIASGSHDYTVWLWETESGTTRHILKGHKDWVSSVAYSPSGAQLISGSGDKTVRLWEVESGALVRTLRGHTESVRSVAYAPSGAQIASGSNDYTIRLWDAQSGTLVRTLEGHTAGVNSVVYASSGLQIASASDDETVRLWETESGALRHILDGHGTAVSSVAYSPSGAQLASGCWNNMVRLWDAESGALEHILEGHTDFVTSVVYSPSGSQIASGSRDETVRLWQVERGALVRTRGYTQPVTSVVYSPSGMQIASGSWDQTVRLWDAQSGALERTLEGHAHVVNSVVYSPSGTQIASASKDYTVRLWETASGTLRHTLEGHENDVNSVVYSPSGTQIASASLDDTIRLWDVASGALEHTLKGHTSEVNSVVYSPSGTQIASGSSDDTVRLWDAHSGALKHTLEGHTSEVNSVVYSPNGTQIASGSSDDTVRLWDVQSGVLKHTLEGHTEGVNCVVYSPNGSQVASGSDDKTMRLWDVASGECRAVIDDFDGGVLSIAWKTTREGSYLVAGSEDKLVWHWQVIEEGDTTQTHLLWTSPHGELRVRGTLTEGVVGLSEVNRALLKQRDAEFLEKTEGSTVSSEEDSDEISSAEEDADEISSAEEDTDEIS